jgi:hypothetical protein
MLVTPSGAVPHEGPVGGPFTNPLTSYTLINNTDTAIDYSVSLTHDVGVLINGGTIALTGTLPALTGSLSVDATLASLVDSLPAGLYAEEIVFEDITNGITTVRVHTIEVGRITAYSWNMDTDPGWSTQGSWGYGLPRGGGGEYGFPDPTGGATGLKVYGYNLRGDYENSMSEMHLTTTAIDCSGLSGVKVRFMRHLNVETSTYDHAYFRVSTDGTNFTDVWQNGSEIEDSTWNLREHDISAIADGQAAVYLRWTMGTTDSSWRYSGWNVDDVEISAITVGFFTEYGTGLAGSGGLTPALSGSGSTVVGQNFTIDLVDALGGATAAFAVGFDRAEIPFMGGSLLVNPPLTVFLTVLTGTAGVAGAGEFHAGSSFPDGSLAGITFQIQIWTDDPGAVGGVGLSNGLEVLIGF